MGGITQFPLLWVPVPLRFVAIMAVMDERISRRRTPPGTDSSGPNNPLEQPPPGLLVRITPEQFRSAYDLENWHQPDPDNPAKDLIQQLMMYRAVYGYWNGRNVAVIEYETESGVPPTVMMVATSGGMLHSEQRLMAMLSLGAIGPDVKRVKRMYTDLEPCDSGNPCPDCRTMLAQLRDDPATAHLCPEQIFFTREYDSAPAPGEPTRQQSTDALAAENRARGQDAALVQGLRERARQDLAQGRVVVDGLSNLDTSIEGDLTTVRQRTARDIQ